MIVYSLEITCKTDRTADEIKSLLHDFLRGTGLRFSTSRSYPEFGWDYSLNDYEVEVGVYFYPKTENGLKHIDALRFSAEIFHYICQNFDDIVCYSILFQEKGDWGKTLRTR